MRTILSLILMTLLSVTLLCNDAFAKRFGGGRSFGIQRPMSSFSTAAKPGQTAGLFNKNPATNRWGGMLGGLFGGLLLGGLLSALFMGKGFLTGIVTWLIVAGIILLIINLFRRRMPSTETQGLGQGQNQSQFGRSPFDSFKDRMSDKYQQFTQQGQGFQQGNAGAASGFMSNGSQDDDFLREAKVKFIRLQTAYDQQNLDDIREFTSPEVVGEIQMQFQEQEGAENKTEVVSLDAELIGREEEGNTEIASVRFTGSIKENSEQAEPLNEIWHFQRVDGGKWVVSGVQQIKPL